MPLRANKSSLIVAYIVLNFLASLSVRGSAQPQVTDSPECAGLLALNEISSDWQKVLRGWTIMFHPGKPGLLGLINADERCIDIWIREGQSSKNVSASIAHELAHAFDYDYMTPELRNEWLRARNLPPNTSWYPSRGGRSDYRCGAGDFAECVSRTFLNRADIFRSKLGPPPNETQKALIRKWLCDAIETAGD